MTDLSPITEGLGEIHKAFAEFKEKHAAEQHRLDEKLKDLEAELDLDSPRGGAPSPDAKVQRLYTDDGEALLLPSDVKMTDVIRPEKRPPVSLERWMHAACAGAKCQDQAARAYFEQESKSLVTTTTGVLVPTQFMPAWIDALRAKSVLNRAGMRTATMMSKSQQYSAVTADPTAYWRAEAGALTAVDPTFASRTLTAETLTVRVQASVELAQDSPNFGAQLLSVIARAMAAEIDRVGLEGSGSGSEPAGILNTSGRSSQTSVGALTDYEEIISGIGALLGANCDLDQVARFAIMSPGSWTAYENLVTGISSDKTQLPRPKSIENMQFLVTSNVAGDAAASPAVTTTIYLGDFRDLLLGVRQEASIKILEAQTYATNLLLEIVAYTRVDFALLRPASFHTVEDVAA